MTKQPRTRNRISRNSLVAGLCAVFVVGMIGMAYAAVPLYRLFCQVTGYGGTTQVASEGSTTVIDRRITVRFDANVSREMGWSFKPAQRLVELNVGETALAFYRAENKSSVATVGTATFNVTPLAAGAYFNKIDCFCFTEQALAPGQVTDMPVSFFVDPSIAEDPDLAKVNTITLSYTFFPTDSDDESDRPDATGNETQVMN